MKRLVSLVLLALLFPFSLAGCAEKDTRVLTAEEAPLGPSSLKVGENRIGQYLRTTLNMTYHFTMCHGEGECESQTMDDHRYVERWISKQHTSDAFLSPVDVYVYKFRYTDLDPDEGDFAMSAVATSASAYDVRNRRPIYEDHAYSYTFPTYQCELFSCSRGSPQKVEVDQRYFPRTQESPEWGTLAGQVLTLHKTLTFNRTETSVHDGVTYVYEYYRNYTATREAEFKGERVFAIKVDEAVRQVKPAPEAPSNPGPSEAPEPIVNQGNPRPPPPKPIQYTYVSAKSPVPVKQVRNFPMWDEREKRYVWQNFSQEVDVIEVGTEVVKFGTEPFAAYQRSASAGTATAGAFAKEATSTLTYGLGPAWSNMEANPTESSFKDYLTSNPKGYPLRAVYFPDSGHNSFTWTLTMTAPGATSDPMAFESRVDYGGPQRAVPVHQSRANDNFRWHGEGPLKEPALQTPLVKFEEAYELYKQARPGAAEPAVEFNMRPGWSKSEPVVASLSFGPAAPRSGGGEFFGLSQNWRVTDSVDINLLDGGLRGFNLSTPSGYNNWPWFPLTGAASASALDAGFQAWVPPPLRATLPSESGPARLEAMKTIN